jgi:hypothetical protein
MAKSKGGFYEWGFVPRVPVDGIEVDGPKGAKDTAYLELNDKPSFGKYDYEADGEGSKGPAATSGGGKGGGI